MKTAAEISIARSAAHAMLLAIEAGLGHSDELLRENPAMMKMSDADRRLTTALVLGVVRWQIQLDEWIRRFLSKPNAKLDPAVLAALRLGAYQLLLLDRVPAHAAINDSVELTKRSGCSSAAGLVNAVLRKLAAASDLKTTRQGLQSAAPAHPQWMVDRWTRFFGFDTACAICVHDQSEPVAAVRLSAAEVEGELVKAGVILEPGALLKAARVVEDGDIRDTRAFREGRVRLQDEGSQLVGEIAAVAAAEPRKILDCCAAPGGKTMILAERHPWARVVACEMSRPRLQHLRERLAGFGQRVECRQADATALSFDSEFDIALADVPCSGTGTLARNPEIRHRLRQDDLLRHPERQRAILRSALRALRPGGRVLYSTCSLEPEENEEVVATVVGQSSNARIVPLGPALDLLRDRGVVTNEAGKRIDTLLTPEGFLRIVPGTFGTEGFFVAMLERGPFGEN